jgi:sRNA-binding protein
VLPLVIGAGALLVERLRVDLMSVSIFRRRWLGLYFSSGAYLLAIAQPGGRRHDLDSFPMEPVSEDHRAEALAQLARRRELKIG